MSNPRKPIAALGFFVLLAAAIVAPVTATELERWYQPKQCGPVALYVVCRWHGIDTSVKELAELAGLDRKGVTLAGLTRAAQAKGLKATAWKSTPSQLAAIPGPAIIDWPEGHFVVLLRWQDGAAVLFDPPAGLRTIAADELAARWGGHLVTFGR